MTEIRNGEWQIIYSLTTYQFTNSVKTIHIYSVFNIKISLKIIDLLLCGPLWPSMISIRGSSFCAQKLEPRMLKKK